MKKVIILISIIAFLFVVNISYADTAVRKLGRGIANVLTSPIEIGMGIADVNQEKGIIAASTWGVISGFFRMGGRALAGFYEAITFPLPPYDPIIKDPEFLLEDWF